MTNTIYHILSMLALHWRQSRVLSFSLFALYNRMEITVIAVDLKAITKACSALAASGDERLRLRGLFGNKYEG